MKKDTEREADRMEPEIIAAADYLSCEKILIRNIREHLAGMDDSALQAHAAALAEHYETKIKVLQNTRDCVNYRYASAFLRALQASPQLSGWIRSTKL